MFRTLLAACFAALLAFSAHAAVDVNKASQAELESIKGIGPGLSGKILQARQSAAFKDWSDLVERVGGVGPGNAKRFSEHGLTVGGVAYEGGAARGDKAAKPAKSDKAEKADKPAKPAATKAATPQS